MGGWAPCIYACGLLPATNGQPLSSSHQTPITRGPLLDFCQQTTACPRNTQLHACMHTCTHWLPEICLVLRLSDPQSGPKQAPDSSGGQGGQYRETECWHTFQAWGQWGQSSSPGVGTRACRAEPKPSATALSLSVPTPTGLSRGSGFVDHRGSYHPTESLHTQRLEMGQPLAWGLPKIPRPQQNSKHQFREHFDLTFNCWFNFYKLKCRLPFYLYIYLLSVLPSLAPIREFLDKQDLTKNIVSLKFPVSLPKLTVW